MNFFDSTDKENSLYHHTLFLLGLSESDTTTLPVDGTFTRSANVWYRTIVNWIWRSQSDWRFDDGNISGGASDGNYTFDSTAGIPEAVHDLTAGTREYTLPSTARDINRVEVLNSDGDYQVVRPLDSTQIKRQSISEFLEEDALPIWYDLVGTVIRLFPGPSATDVTTTNGLKLYLSRDIDPFTPSDTTQKPAFDVAFHPAISYGAAFDFATARGLASKKVDMREGLDQFKKDIEEYYSKRHSDFKKKIRPRRENYDTMGGSRGFNLRR